ncbi:MAG: hypothetical protein V4582_15215 [Pseudomonadota bacterium]
MRVQQFLAYFLCLCSPLPVHAQSSAGERSAMQYLEFVGMSKRAPICATRIAGFAAKFEPAFAKWQKENSVTLEKGESFLRAAAAAAKMDYAAHVGAVTDTSARLLESASPNIVNETCNAMLQKISAP